MTIVSDNRYKSNPGRNRTIEDTWATWLRPIPWQMFATLTFPWNVAEETADRKFREFMNSLERSLKTNVAFIAGKEARTKTGDSVPWHFHLALTSARPMPADLIQRLWNRTVGRGRDSERFDEHGAVSQYEHAMVAPYDPVRPGIEYLVKLSHTTGAYVDHKWLHLFNPEIDRVRPRGEKSLRQNRRWNKPVSESIMAHSVFPFSLISA
jgi:hypothetical protein